MMYVETYNPAQKKEKENQRKEKKERRKLINYKEPRNYN